jgi:VWFA-related protein
MKRRAVVVLGGSVLVAAMVLSPAAGAKRSQIEPVEIDVVAVDERGQPVGGLHQADFTIREDGRTVAVDSLTEVSPDTSRDPRTIVLVLDDTGIEPALTTMVQRIARMFVSRMGVSDRLNVVRFNNRGDEAVGGRDRALERIDDYTAGTVPFFGRETLENALTKVTKLSRQFEAIEHRRKTIVAIASPRVFDVQEPAMGHGSLLWDYWVSAVTSASRANVSVCVVDPEGISNQFRVTGNGLVFQTGGIGFYNSNAFETGVDRIWGEAGHYYVLGYTPPQSAEPLHKLDVKISRPGITARARRTRG